MAISSRKPQEKAVGFRSKPSGTTQAFFTANEKHNSPVCVFCKKEHLSLQCSNVTDVKERKAIILNPRVCVCCLKGGHRAKSCNRRCKKCGGLHHHTICLKNATPSKDVESNDNNIASVSATSKSRQNGLMVTASVLVYGEDRTKKTRITMLFDSGSQRSYVTEELKRKLHLPINSSETINLNTFGFDKCKKVKLDSVMVNVEVKDNEVIQVSALTQNVICTPVSTRVNVGQFPHLQGLELADCFENNNSKRIDMLIGLDSYFQFIHGDVIHGKLNEPVALKSKLGWILSGKVCSNKSYEISCVTTNLILEGFHDSSVEGLKDQEIHSTLKEFWRHEECGLI